MRIHFFGDVTWHPSCIIPDFWVGENRGVAMEGVGLCVDADVWRYGMAGEVCWFVFVGGGYAGLGAGDGGVKAEGFC